MIPTLTGMSSSSSHNANLHRSRKSNGRRPTIARSKSFIGTIKNFLPAPLAAWLGSTDDFATEDTKGKRRNLASSNAGDNLADDGSSRTKRIRVSSPDRLVTSGYLDPPGQIFQQPAQQFQQLQPNYPSIPNRSSSVTIPTTTLQQHPRNRHTISPFRSNSFSRPETISRTMSMDPPYQRTISRDATMMSIHRESSMEDLYPPSSRDISMPPARTSSIRMRTSLTPQPSGSGFGPTGQQRDRDRSEPPPLHSLMSKPIFVRAPPEQGVMSAQPTTTTLGSFVDSQRNTRSPVRQHSALLFGSQPGSISDIPSAYHHPINAAEKALYELDVYKTPLLPTRLRGSSALPEMFKPRTSRKLILMADKEAPDHSGISGKNKGRGKEEVNGTKPYAGEGGMKKLLARRKKEAEEEREKEKSEAIEEEVEEQKDRDQFSGDKAVRRHEQKTTPEIVPILSPTDNSQFNVASEREQSSLRVGRTKTSRNHISRPVSRAKNRFSAFYDEDDGEDQAMDEGKFKDQIMLEEAAQNIPVFNIPSGFSFPKETTPVQHDLTKAKEPPMASLPFSLSNANNASTSVGSFQPPASLSEQPPKASPSIPRPPSATPSASMVASVAEHSTTSIFGNLPLAPSISLIPPTPVAVKAPTEVSSTQSVVPGIAAPVPSTGVPNFFANSSVLTKPTISIITPSSTPPVPVIDAENPLWEGEKKDQTNSVESSFEQNSLFGGAEKPVAATSVFGASSTNGAGAVSAFESRAPSTVFGTSASGRSESGTTTSTTLFGVTPNTTESIPQSFPFNPSKHTELSIPNPPLLDSSANNGEIPKVREPVTKPASEVLKPSPLFGAPSTNSFGELDRSTISTSPFGQPAPASSPSATSFLFGQPSSTTQAADANKTPFSFSATPSTTPTAAEEKPSFSFAAPVAAPAGSGFSFTPTSSSTSDVSSKPFSFGTAPGRSVTPPKNEEQEFRMEESPTRDMQLNGKQADTESRPSVSFQFSGTGSSTGSLFGQPSQTTSATFPFSSTLPSNPFTKTENKTEDKPPSVSFSGFGQTQQPSTGFSFGPKKTEPEPARPSSSFSFQPTSATSGSSFAFGAPATNNSNPFSQVTTQGSSTPSSPLTFNQPPAFSFTQPTPAPGTSFTFGGSQPASPAIGNTSLPQPPTPGGFTFSPSGGTTPTSPFSATAPAPSAGGALFTIGAPPAPASGSAGRTFKKLPNRRGAKR